MIQVQSLRLEVGYPEGHKPPPRNVEGGNPAGQQQASRKEVIAEAADEPGFDAFRTGISLDKYKEIDGLTVALVANYAVRRERFQYWTMAHPTKNFDITVNYPKECRLQLKSLVINEDHMVITTRPGYLRAKYESWVLPEAGIAFLILPPAEVQAPAPRAREVTAA